MYELETDVRTHLKRISELDVGPRTMLPSLICKKYKTARSKANLFFHINEQKLGILL